MEHPVSVPSISPPTLGHRCEQRILDVSLLAFLGGLSPRSRLTIQERLRAVARMMEVPYEQVAWHELRAHHVEWIRQALTDRDVAPTTMNVTLRTEGDSQASQERHPDE